MRDVNYKQLKSLYFKSRDTWSERLIIEKFSAPLAYVILKLNQSRKLPYALTMMGFCFFLVGAILVYLGFYAIGAILCFCGVIVDHFDGVTARFIYGKDPSLRGFLDLTVDSFSATVILFTLFWVFWMNEMFSGLFLLFLYIVLLFIFWIQCSSNYRLLSEFKTKKSHSGSYLTREDVEKSKTLKFLAKLYVNINRLAKKHRTLPHPTACDAAFLIYVVLPLLSFQLHVPIIILGISFLILDIFESMLINYAVIQKHEV